MPATCSWPIPSWRAWEEHLVWCVMCGVNRGSECSDLTEKAGKTKACGEPLGALDMTTRMFQSIFIIDGEQMIPNSGRELSARWLAYVFLTGCGWTPRDTWTRCRWSELFSSTLEGMYCKHEQWPWNVFQRTFKWSYCPIKWCPGVWRTRFLFIASGAPSCLLYCPSLEVHQ